MKKLISIIILTALAAGVLFTAGCKKDDPSVIVDIWTPQPALTSVPVTFDPSDTDVPTATPGSSDDPTADPGFTDAPTAAPTPVGPVEPDQSVFDDAAFIGNSVFEGLYRFGIITHGTFFTKVGLNVNSVFTAHLDNSSVPIIDELNTGTYNKVILFFGSNELGWPSYPGFIERYSNVIDAVWQRQPGCKIYICALLPTNKARDDKNENGFTNANINTMNGMIKDLCDERGVTYIDVPAGMFDEFGRLPDDASSDGQHPNLKYDRIWAEHICLKVMGVI